MSIALDPSLSDTWAFLLRWFHFLAGITWIGMLYYFNFVQGEFFKETDPAAKTAAIKLLVPRALWWFRWGAMFTFLTGFAMYSLFSSQGGVAYLNSSMGIFISVGGLLGTFMFLNVWLIIWPNQKIVIAKAKGEAVTQDPAAAGAKALVASRTNVMFSIPMLFLMGASKHLNMNVDYEYSGITLWVALFAIIGLLELNAVKLRKLGMMTSVGGVIHAGLALTVALYAVIEILT